MNIHISLQLSDGFRLQALGFVRQACEGPSSQSPVAFTMCIVGARREMCTQSCPRAALYGINFAHLVE